MAGIEDALRFPFVNLEKAMERAKQLYDGDPRGAQMAVKTAFSLWNYSEKSSGGNQTVSALKAYGLLSDAGSSEGRRIQLSPNALQYFKDEREEVRQRLLSGFATSPPLLKSLFQDWGAQPPSDTVARSHLKVDRGLAEQSARTLLGIYKDNLAFASLTGESKIPEVGGEANRPDMGPAAKLDDYVRWTKAPFDQADRPHRVTWVSEDGKFIRIHGNPTGIPMNEVAVVNAPKLEGHQPRGGTPSSPAPAGTPGGRAGSAQQQDFTVLLTGGRLQITADVDAVGVAKLKEMLTKYEEILKLLN